MTDAQEKENGELKKKKNKPFVPFQEEDFEAFEPEKRKERSYNRKRLEVRRKLESLGHFILPILLDAGLKLRKQTSLHHPYTYNKFNVDSQWVYFSREKAGFKELRDIFGSALGQDLDPSYTHVLLVISIDLNKIEISLKIHEKAWWDGQNLKNKCQYRQQRDTLLNLLKPLQSFQMRIHDWDKLYPCEALKLSDLETFFHYYIPGEHWFHLYHSLSRESSIGMSDRFSSYAVEKLLLLAPVYRFIEWTPGNNFLFSSNKKVIS